MADTAATDPNAATSPSRSPRSRTVSASSAAAEWLPLPVAGLQSGRLGRRHAASSAVAWRTAVAGTRAVAGRLEVLRENSPPPPQAPAAAAASVAAEQDGTTRLPPRSLRKKKKWRTLQGHAGCVNSLAWNRTGTRLVSGSDDCTLKIWDPSLLVAEEPLNPLLASYETGHIQNIFSARFMTGDERCIASCAANGHVRYMMVDESGSKVLSNGLFACHSAMAYEVLPDSDNPSLFFSCSDDGTVNQYDTREATSCDCRGCARHVLIDANLSRTTDRSSSALEYSKTHLLYPPPTSADGPAGPEQPPSHDRFARAARRRHFFGEPEGVAVAAISLNPLHPAYLALGCSDDVVRVYDRRWLAAPGRNWGADPPGTAQRGEVYAFRPSEFGRGVLADGDDDGRPAGASGGEDSESGSDFGILRRHSRRSQPGRRRRRVREPRRITAMKFDPVEARDILVSYAGDTVLLVSPNAGKGVIGCAFEDPVVSSFAAGSHEGGSGTAADAVEVGGDSRRGRYLPPDDRDEDITGRYTGHMNRQTMIKEAYFYGPGSEYIMSGSDDGTLWVWDKKTARVVNRLKCDRDVVNCIAPNPFDMSLAVSGIDSDIKLVVPTADHPWVDPANVVPSSRADDSSDDDDDDDGEGRRIRFFGVGGDDDDDDDEDNDGDDDDDDDDDRARRRMMLLLLLAQHAYGGLE
ncbi:hypothetical protein HK405_003026 [Cladochytrium tenue]|nr:hypothetical protein HK405_003026 [Cladochytrium tenue]